MLNFKKGSIFSRSAGNEDDYEEYKQEDQGGVLAVWGSPGSGKTTVAARIAKHLAGKRKNTILLLCDMSAPMLPCICPPRDLENKGSLGSVLAAAHVSDSLIKNNLTTHKRLDYLSILGLVKGESEYTYPPYSDVQARELIDGLRNIAPYVVIDCGSYIANDMRCRRRHSGLWLMQISRSWKNPSSAATMELWLRRSRRRMCLRPSAV